MGCTEGITMFGKPLEILGETVLVGQKAPDFAVLDEDLAPKTLADFAGKIKVFSVTPSVDTPVCDLQVRHFNEEALTMPDVLVANVSMDLPFALKRYACTIDDARIVSLSDHREASFGMAYGVLMGELRLLARSVFIVDEQDVVRYAHVVPEQTQEPDYDAVLSALAELRR